jgi:hypothetical protein
MGLSARIFYRRQRAEQALGGRISPAKLAWLAYAVFVWFLLCPLLAADEYVARPFRIVLGLFAVWMWCRGVVELFMLYVTKNWRPPLGLAHDLLSLVLVAAGYLLYRQEIGVLHRSFDYWTLGFLFCVFCSLGLETLYASLFHQAVQGDTTGDQAVWFVSESDTRLSRVNRLSALCNVPLYGFLLLFLGVCFGLW